MAVGEGMAVVELAVKHIHPTLGTGFAGHDMRRCQTTEVEIVERRWIQPFRTVEHPVVIGCELMSAGSASHHHTRQRKIVLFRGVERHSGTSEQTVTLVGTLALVPLILVGFQEKLLALTAALALAMAIADVGVAVPFRRVIVDVETRVAAASRVDSGLHTAVIARFQVFFHHDVDDAGRAFRREFRRRIVDDFDALDALGRQLLQDLRTVVGGQAARLAVDPNFDARIAAQRDVAVVIDLDRRDVFQRLRCRLPRIRDELRHVERLAIDLQLHRRPLARHRHFLQLLRVFRKVDDAEILRAVAVAERKLSRDRLVADIRDFQRVITRCKAVNRKIAFGVGNRTFHKSSIALLQHFHSHKP